MGDERFIYYKVCGSGLQVGKSEITLEMLFIVDALENINLKLENKNLR